MNCAGKSKSRDRLRGRKLVKPGLSAQKFVVDGSEGGRQGSKRVGRVQRRYNCC